jgi:prepilin-type N-terminal cleavage/methylation domain-containing protein
MPRRAFTLIELLVVIAIIGLLTTIAVIALGSVRKNAINLRRVADMRQIFSAFTMEYTNLGYYPFTNANWACMSTICTGWSGQFSGVLAVDSVMIPTYLGSKPVYPPDSSTTTLGGYIYNSNWGGDSGTGLPAGTALIYALVGSVPCNLGRFYSGTASYTQCVIYLDQ